MTDFNSFKVVSSISDLHRMNNEISERVKTKEKGQHFTLWYELATWNTPEWMPISKQANVLDFLAEIIGKHEREFNALVSLSDLSVTYDGTTLPNETPIYNLIKPTISQPIIVSWDSAFRLLWEDEIEKISQKILRKK